MFKRRYFLILGIGLVVLMQVLVFALIPPPPVNQNMGVYDTLFVSYNETMCRNCHASGVPDTHHNLVAEGKYGCTDCHPVDSNGSGITLVRDCLQCHDTTFNGMVIRRPHHETQAATDRHCNACHGSLVDNYDDGHYIPTSPPSNMTPSPTFKVINQTSGRKWGGCESCHEEYLSANPFIASNNETHHRLGNLSGFKNNDSTKCIICHDIHNASYGADSIRYCERCHGTNSLHNVQWDMANTTQITGYGHLGPNDCQGCHAWYVAGNLAPGSDIIMPTIYSLSTNKVLEGTSNTLTIYGDNFVTTVDSITRSSTVMVTTEINNITISPDSISRNQIVVTLPPLSEGLYGIHVHKEGNARSNTLPLVSAPNVVIDSARKVSSKITITGSGFGTYDLVYQNFVNVTIKGGISRSVQITNWSDRSIIVTSSDAKIGDIVTVNSVYGTNSSQIS